MLQWYNYDATIMQLQCYSYKDCSNVAVYKALSKGNFGCLPFVEGGCWRGPALGRTFCVSVCAPRPRWTWTRRLHCRSPSGNIQGTSCTAQGTFREHWRNIEGTLREHWGNTQQITLTPKSADKPSSWPAVYSALVAGASVCLEDSSFGLLSGYVRL
jgi:hypothetical protein